MAADGAGRGSTARGRLQGKIALITGGAAGLGKATAEEFIQEGASVVIADINSTMGLNVAQNLGPHAHFIHCDVTIEDSVAGAVDATVAKHGRLDVMVNNAGVIDRPSNMPEMASLDLAEFDRVMGVNVRGTVAGIKHAMRVMAPTGSGCILCISSISGILGGIGSFTYSVSKFTIIGLVKTAACELSRHGIRINCITAHAVPTPMSMELFSQMFPGADEARLEEIIRGLGELKGATCEAVDVAKAAVYLASDDAKYVSGDNLVVDGGYITYKHINLPPPNAGE